ncbi:DNA damage-regulated autophagy modulator protein 1 [Pungitius pungitius]|uniref:DNA damage-regulated autophagy modulator protein 1 n=1 Tax=Pungitius pungitius TaxID=134920 RepID=UPI0018886478|nr:DNA damage-regulated autophagy modulator protein 1 [Pungitius pungitius]
MFWFQQGLCFLPAFLVVWSSATFIVSYLIALFRHDVDVIFPYISDTGANPPESCIFGLMTFVSACAGTLTVYARYKLVEKLGGDSVAVDACLNKTALVLGMSSCLGMCVVATFQETTVTEVHDAGALLFFVPGVSYTALQSVLSYRARLAGSSAAVCRARSGIAALAAVALFPTVICAFFVTQTTLHRDAGDEDYPFHVASAVCEWIVAFSFICFFLTYIDEFKLFTLRVKAELKE